MLDRLRVLCQKIIRPITENPVFFVAIFSILYLPSLVYWIVNYCDWLRLYALLAFPVSLALSYALSFTLHIFQKRKHILKIFYYWLFGVASALEVLLIAKFYTRFSPLMFRLLSETNREEALEFLYAYIFQVDTLLCVIGFFLVVFFVVVAEKKTTARTLKLPDVLAGFLACGVLASSVLYVYRDVNFLPKLFAKNIDAVMGTRPIVYGTPYISLGLILQSAKIHTLSYNDVDVLVSSLSEQNLAVSTYSGNIVLVIGESFIKHHSNLYGYALPTNPLLEEERKHRNLFLFNDVVASYNSTSKSMQQIMSFFNQESNQYWAKYPLFPTLFKNAGFCNILISNQECAKSANEWDCANYYLVSPQTSGYLFDWCSQDIKQWDMDMVLDNAEEVFGRIATRNLLVYHLIGQHVGYKERCPDSDRIFVLSDYQYRNDLTTEQKTYVAHYDNATRYNDKVVAAILDQFRDKDAIVIYLSDHGEEVYDYRDHMGRSHEPIVTPERAKYQFEVPFMIWMSDKYKENHPDVVAQVERSVDRPFMIDDLPHLMLDLAGIECEWFDPTRSVINDQFNEKRKRLLLDSKQDYDVIMGRRND